MAATTIKNLPPDLAARLVIVLACAVVLAAAWLYIIARQTATTSRAALKVVAAENFWGNIAAQIGGTKTDVTSIITDPNADPHLYESDARAADTVSTADVVIENGLGYDDFMNKLLSTAAASNRHVLSAAAILHVTGANPNPHLWYDTPRVLDMADAIKQALVEKDPGDTAYFNQNLHKFDQSLTPILTTINQIKQRYPGAPVAYTERVPGYLLENAGLTIKTPPGFANAIEDGTDPSPADTLAFDSLITSHSIKVILYNAQATSSVTQHIRDLAAQNGIPVVGVTETLPKNEPTYQSWQLDQAKALLTALGN